MDTEQWADADMRNSLLLSAPEEFVYTQLEANGRAFALWRLDFQSDEAVLPVHSIWQSTEKALLARKSAIIDLALARFGQHPSTLYSLLARYPLPPQDDDCSELEADARKVRVAACLNRCQIPYLDPRIFLDTDNFEGLYSEPIFVREPLTRNPEVSADFLAWTLTNRWWHEQEIWRNARFRRYAYDDERFRSHSKSLVPRSGPPSDTASGLSESFEYDGHFSHAWRWQSPSSVLRDCLARGNATDKTPTWETMQLLVNSSAWPLNSPRGDQDSPTCTPSLADPWIERAKLQSDRDGVDLNCRRIAAMMASLFGGHSPDPQMQRCAWYGVGDLSVSEIDSAFNEDHEMFLWAALFNDSLFVGMRREAMEALYVHHCRMIPDLFRAYLVRCDLLNRLKPAVPLGPVGPAARAWLDDDDYSKLPEDVLARYRQAEKVNPPNANGRDSLTVVLIYLTGVVATFSAVSVVTPALAKQAVIALLAIPVAWHFVHHHFTKQHSINTQRLLDVLELSGIIYWLLLILVAQVVARLIAPVDRTPFWDFLLSPLTSFVAVLFAALTRWSYVRFRRTNWKNWIMEGNRQWTDNLLETHRIRPL